jgi:Polyketide cyclase / dehydrase and lipid transport
MLIPILGGIITVLACFLIFVATRPSEFRVTRSLTVNAPPAAVFPHVDTLKNWEAWNPWGKIDPKMKLTYDGPPAGAGASYAWVGNREVGEGKATITGSKAGEFVRFKMEFFKPMAGVSDTLFTFKPQGGHTEVTWAMTGKNNFIAKAFCLFMNMDRMIGGQFEKGLADLKRAVESAAKA